MSRRITTAASAVALAAGCLVTFGLGAPGAGAAPAKDCPKSGGAYPPGKCTVAFTKSTYKRPSHAAFRTGRVFKPGETVRETVTCAHGFKKLLQSSTAHAAGAVSSGFHVGSEYPKGTCTLAVIGVSSGTIVKGTFHVK